MATIARSLVPLCTFSLVGLALAVNVPFGPEVLAGHKRDNPFRD
jgi:hypothetical protein